MPLSNGITNLCTSLRAHGDRSAFPPGYEVLRVGTDETTAMWFKRCVDLFMGGHPERCAIDDDHRIGVVAVLETEKNGTVRYLNAQAVVAADGQSLADLYLGADGNRATYLRLEFSPHSDLGPMFRESHPHLHASPDGAPWHPFRSARPIADLAEFLFRNWNHKRWEEWAMEVWEQERRRMGQSHTDDRFPRLLEAYKASKFVFVRANRETVEEVRKVLRRAIDEMHRATIDIDDSNLTFGP